MNPLVRHKQFMVACGQTTETLNMKQAQLYWHLCNEEFDELTTAFMDFRSLANTAHDDAHLQELTRKFLTETLDGIGDLIWVAAGLARSLGVDPSNILNVIADSNMSKVDPVTGRVLKRDDGKVLKPAGYIPPNLRPIAEAALQKEEA